MQQILDRYKIGVEVVGINLQQGGVRPPEQVESAFDDVLRAGHALADLELAVLGVADEPSRRAARSVTAAWLMGEGPERDALIAEARALRREVDPSALPILLPALSLGDIGAWRKPLAYWWAARRGRY